MGIALSFSGEVIVREALPSHKFVNGIHDEDLKRECSEGRVLCQSMGHGFYISIERCTIIYRTN